VVNAVLLKPLPFRDADRLVGLWHTSQVMGNMLAGQSYATYDTYRRLNRTLADLALYEPTPVNVDESGSRPERVTAARVSARFFSVLGEQPLLGRFFAADEDQAGRDNVIVIGEGMWRSRFGATSQVIGSRVRVDGVVREVIGVVADRGRFPQGDTEL